MKSPAEYRVHAGDLELGRGQRAARSGDAAAPARWARATRAWSQIGATSPKGALRCCTHSPTA